MRHDWKDGLAKGMSVTTLAGGCFWGVEHLFRDLPGILKTQVGYIGGQTSNPLYPAVKTGKTGHAEAIQIVFDPAKISYTDILEWFFRLHDPTTLNRQGGDIGSQYRSAIYIYSSQQRSEAERVIGEEGQRGRWQDPIVTQIEEAGVFWPAEEYHQDYLVKNPEGYMCHFIRD
jgi:methionine-S-sulfoxide reductase